MTENEIARQIVNVAYKIHTELGPGQLETAYQAVMVYELQKLGLRVEAEKPIPLIYESLRVEAAFRADLIVEDKVIVELKSVEILMPVHMKQVLTYLRLTNKRLGLVINFGAELLKQGIRRVANKLDEEVNDGHSTTITRSAFSNAGRAAKRSVEPR